MKNFSWSYSRLKGFEVCPRRHFHYDIAKDIKEPESTQMTEGNAAHKAFENYIRNGTKLPLPYLQHEHILARLAAMPGEIYAEQRLALTAEFKPVDYFGKGVWFRTVIDYCCIHDSTAAVIDYKTGRPGPDLTQLQLMSATIMHYDQRVKQVRARLLFMNHDHAERHTFLRSDVPLIWSQILPRVARLRQAIKEEEFPAKPGGLCKRYCAVTTCPYHGRGTQ